MTAKIERFPATKIARSGIDVASVVRALHQSREIRNNIRHHGKIRELPSSPTIAEILQGIINSLFPTHLGPPGLDPGNIDLFVSNTLTMALNRLRDQIARGMQFVANTQSASDLQRQAKEIVRAFASDLPAIRDMLVDDLKAALRHDASAESLSEILICHRSFTAIIHHRLAHVLHRLGATFVARMMADLAHVSTGIDIHPGARIGAGFFISRGTGVVIGETAVIGRNVCIHQGVTLGESELASDGSRPCQRNIPRHPLIGDNVIIYSGATLLGRMTVGAGSVIHGNVWLTRSIPPGTIVRQAEPRHSDAQAYV